jgi:hypothetical protein
VFLYTGKRRRSFASLLRRCSSPPSPPPTKGLDFRTDLKPTELKPKRPKRKPTRKSPLYKGRQEFEFLPDDEVDI